MKIFNRASLTLTLCVAALAPLDAVAQTPDNAVEVIVFPSAANWPIFVAQEKGLFAAEGLAVNLTPTPDSKFQMVNLIDGQFNIAMTAMDNVVAYAEGQGAAPTTANPDIIAVMGVDSGFLSLVATPDVASYADLKGKTLGVDALTTGFAFVLLQMLEDGGVARSEVAFAQKGGVKQRFDALMQKEISATILVSPLEAAAQHAGFTNLGSASTTLGAYQGVVAAVRRDWAADNAEKVEDYIRAYRAALDWLYQPDNRDEAIAILRQSIDGMPEGAAAAAYSIILNPETGLFRDAAIDAEGVNTVLALRNRFGGGAQLTDPSKYVDLSYHSAAASN